MNTGSPNSPDPSESSHSRRRRGVPPIIRFLGSVKFAMILFLAIIVMASIGTIYESQLNTKIARYYVYEAPWFVIWLILLCVNLACATLTRLPWRKRHTGFIITHAGIIILLVGAMIGRIWGVEGSMTLRIGESPRTFMLIDELHLQFEEPGTGHRFRVEFPVDLRPPSEERKRTYNFPSGNGRFVFDNYSENLSERHELVEEKGSGNPGIQLKIHSGMMGQSIHPALLRYPGEDASYDLFGMAHIRLVDEIDPPSKASTHPRPELQIRILNDETVEYSARNSHGHTRTGQLSPGERFLPGWADWEITLEGLEKDGGLQRTIVEDGVTSLQESMGIRGMPGVRGWMELADGRRSEPRWLIAGEAYEIEVGEARTELAFGFRTEPLPFSVSLENFKVPRDEGTNQPAAFISHLAFRDLETGDVVRDTAGMNNPAMYPPEFHRYFTGWNWKFSQAHWNPEDLSESTVQILRDPGWPLKWIGSLVIITGVFIIFYVAPYRHRRPEDSIDEKTTAPAPSPKNASSTLPENSRAQPAAPRVDPEKTHAPRDTVTAEH